MYISPTGPRAGPQAAPDVVLMPEFTSDRAHAGAGC
jgi:hypothetical protein